MFGTEAILEIMVLKNTLTFYFILMTKLLSNLGALLSLRCTLDIILARYPIQMDPIIGQ